MWADFSAILGIEKLGTTMGKTFENLVFQADFIYTVGVSSHFCALAFVESNLVY